MCCRDGGEEEKPQTQNRTQEEKLRTDTKSGAIVLRVINSYYLSCVLQRTQRSARNTRTRPTHIFSPFRLFSEVARPLSKVRVAKGRVHFHIFPFDMRRPSIQGYVFLRRFLPLPLSAPLRSFLHPLVPSSTRCVLAWGVLGRRDTNNYRATTGERNTGLCVCVCVWVRVCTRWRSCSCKIAGGEKKIWL